MSLSGQTMLIPNGELDQTGEPCRADGYYGYADGLHTIGFYLMNFIGRIYVDASLSDNPGDNDWFPVTLGAVLDFEDYEEATTGVKTFNIIGNFVYLRARIARTSGNFERVVLSI